ncbi:sensor histidine kinase [Catenuloplanes japonicus]|uniref:sensor histidine kinase n=1 Tax=Catenuloplanes japonicus TaxID=33876 RepID=UPI000A105746|nr:histidine kinase [Catenuloplanes japonicus]
MRWLGRLVRADDPETGWLVRIVLSTLLLWMLLFSGPASPGVRPVLTASFAAWLYFVVMDRRTPRAALVALALAALLPAGVTGRPEDASALLFLYGALLTFVLLTRTPLPAILALTGMIIVVLLIGLHLTGHGATAMLTQPGLVLIVVLFGLHRREFRLRAEQTALLLEQTSRTQQAQAHAAALDERTRISRELHDVLAHSLGALGVQLEVAEAQLDKHRYDEATVRVKRARRLAADGLAEARAAVAALRTDVPPLPEALDGLVATHRANHGVEVTLRVDGTARQLESEPKMSLLRTAREALTNAAKHAPGVPVEIDLEFGPDTTRLTVANSAAPEHAPGDGHGLIGARERLALVGGTLDAAYADGVWRVDAEVPA